ncbi:hypothetical protein DR864_26985 [Runella rosea]|uniref:DUF1963 domain-containing protein n=1 Tax=Runella rosea TaxID=2259595 RepID=A0A344TR50_9BACT|nr:hypothetical protein [Runella rosea]AXE21121.1 hypothetical protein DR864_26985 [Runella rosea]
MTERVKELLEDFRNKRWEKIYTPYERLFELTRNGDELVDFLESYLKTFKETSTYFDDALSYIDAKQFSKLIQIAIKILQKEENENAENVIAYASLQFPELLNEYLHLIFELEPNTYTYYAQYPWRKCNSRSIQIFKKKLINPELSQYDKERLFKCLLETRDLETINFAYNFATEDKLIDNEAMLTLYLERVGFTIQNNTIKTYCPNQLYHLLFPKNYFPNDQPISINKEQHPTWNLTPTSKKYKFGGILSDDEKNPFFHIFTLDNIPDGLNITELNVLVLGAHLRELNECEAIFYQHNTEGKPSKIQSTDDDIEVYYDNPIKETYISCAVTPERWKFQDWGISNSRENLFRLGGEPTWIQNAEVLKCPICNEKMDFLMQLDSDLPTIQNGELMFGSGGICYVFWCNTSKVSGYTIQCT